MENTLINSRPREALKRALLRNHPLFRALAPPVIERFASSMEQCSVARGGIIFAKGDAGTGLMGVLAGSVRISVASTSGRDIVLNIIHPGEIFGEIALLDGHPRTADATAMTDCELVVIEHRDFMPFLRSEPDLGLRATLGGLLAQLPFARTGTGQPAGKLRINGDADLARTVRARPTGCAVRAAGRRPARLSPTVPSAPKTSSCS